jgi:hypothetical protein
VTGKRRAEKRKDFLLSLRVRGRAIRTVMPFRVPVSFCFSNTIQCSGGTDANGVTEDAMSHWCFTLEPPSSLQDKSTCWQSKPCEEHDFSCRVAETDQIGTSRCWAVIDFRSVKNRAS